MDIETEGSCRQAARWVTHQLQKCQGKTFAAQIAASVQGKVQTCLSPIHDPQTLANRLTDLTNQVGELVNAPNETMYKTNVVEAANRFVSELKHSANGVQQLRQETDQQIKSSVRKIYKYLKEYEKYNTGLAKASARSSNLSLGYGN